MADIVHFTAPGAGTHPLLHPGSRWLPLTMRVSSSLQRAPRRELRGPAASIWGPGWMPIARARESAAAREASSLLLYVSVALASLRLPCLGACSLLRQDWTQETLGRPSLLFLKFYHRRILWGAARACLSASRPPRRALSRGRAVPRAGPCRLSHALACPAALPPRLRSARSSPPRLSRASPTADAAPLIPTAEPKFACRDPCPDMGAPGCQEHSRDFISGSSLRLLKMFWAVSLGYTKYMYFFQILLTR